jgi:K+-transporting ATPase A subunit
MTKFLALVSAAAGAIAAVITVTGDITGNKWLGQNWQETISYFGAVLLGVLAIGVIVLVSLDPQGIVRRVERVDERFRAASPYGRASPRQREIAWRVSPFIAAAVCALFAAALATRANSSWTLGLALILYFAATIGYGVIQELRHRPARTPCPMCQESIHALALMCPSCGARILHAGSPEGEAAPHEVTADLTWL